MTLEQKPRTAEGNGRLWGARARDWADIQEVVCRPVYTAVFDRVGVQSGTAYLDVGCGAGLAAQIAAERGASVSGLDASDSLLSIARTRAPNGDFYLGELESLPFEDGAFDLVTGFNSFQYAGNPSIALSEAKRVAKAGASVVIMTWGTPGGMEAASLVAALKPLLPPPPPGAPGPLHCRTRLRFVASHPPPVSSLSTCSTSSLRGPIPIFKRGCADSGRQVWPHARLRTPAKNQSMTLMPWPWRHSANLMPATGSGRRSGVSLHTPRQMNRASSPQGVIRLL